MARARRGREPGDVESSVVRANRRNDTPAVTVGGSALPGGVMMRSRTRVGVAVRREEDGEIVTEGFDLEPPTARWAGLPLMRGVLAIRTALSIGQKSLTIGERLRWEEPGERHGRVSDEIEAEREDLGAWGKIAIAAGALIGIGVQVA